VVRHARLPGARGPCDLRSGRAPRPPEQVMQRARLDIARRRGAHRGALRAGRPARLTAPPSACPADSRLARDRRARVCGRPAAARAVPGDTRRRGLSAALASRTVAARAEAGPVVAAPRASCRSPCGRRVLSILNHDSAVAAAARRMTAAAQGRPCLEMGSRRTHERAAVAAARAAYIAGFVGTSNLEAGRRYGVPTIGTDRPRSHQALGGGAPPPRMGPDPRGARSRRRARRPRTARAHRVDSLASMPRWLAPGRSLDRVGLHVSVTRPGAARTYLGRVLLDRSRRRLPRATPCSSSRVLDHLLGLAPDQPHDVRHEHRRVPDSTVTSESGRPRAGLDVRRRTGASR
jgi:hypothetical protein